MRKGMNEARDFDWRSATVALKQPDENVLGCSDTFRFFRSRHYFSNA